MATLVHVLVELSPLMSVLLKITCVLAAGWLVHLLLLRCDPRWRMLLWRGVAVALVVVPVAAPLSYLQVSVAQRPAPAPTDTPVVYAAGGFAGVGQPEEYLIPTAHHVEVVTQRDLRPAFSISLWIQEHLQTLLLSVWICVVTVLTVRWIIVFVRIRKRIVSSAPVPSRFQHLLDRVCKDLGSQKAVALRYSHDLPTPFLTAFRAPVLVLPARLIESPRMGELQAVFAHEASHLCSHDLLWMLATRALSTVFWFHPLVWRMCNAHTAACEKVCDAVAADYIGDASSYSSTLARIALATLEAVPAVGGLPMARSAEISARLRVLRRNVYSSPLARLRVALAFVAGVVALAALGGLKFTYAQVSVPDAARLQEPGSRVVHFPTDRSIGTVKVIDADKKRAIETFHHWVDGTFWWSAWEYIGQARGSVVVPTGKVLGLKLHKDALKDLSPLRKLDPNDLHTLIFPYMYGESMVTGACTRHVAHLTGLKVLNMNGIGVAPNSMDFLKELKSLEWLNAPRFVTDADIAAITQVPSLKGLYFKKNDLTNAGLAQLVSLASLEELELGTLGAGSRRITDAGLVHLANLPSLRYLMLWGNFTDAGLIHLEKVSSLRILNLSGLPITNVGMIHLSKLTWLENLGLWNTKVTDGGLSYLKHMRSLKKLDLGKIDFDHSNPPITDAGMAHLKEVKSLEYFSMLNMDLSDKGLAYLAELPNLKHLTIPSSHWKESKGAPYTDKGLKHLARLGSLETLYVCGPAITDEGIEHIARLSNLRDLSLAGESITDEGIARLASLKSLEKLYLREAKITVSGLGKLNPLSNLKELNVGNLVQDGSRLNISGLTELEKLALTFQSYRGGQQGTFQDEDMACLANLKRLKWLQGIRGIGDAGLAHLAGLTEMERLNVSGLGMTDRGLVHLANMKKLNHLTVVGNFTDQGLRYLEGLNSMRFLNIDSGTHLSQSAVNRLRNNLPAIETLRTDKDGARGMGG